MGAVEVGAGGRAWQSGDVRGEVGVLVGSLEWVARGLAGLAPLTHLHVGAMRDLGQGPLATAAALPLALQTD